MFNIVSNSCAIEIILAIKWPVQIRSILYVDDMCVAIDTDKLRQQTQQWEKWLAIRYR